MKQNHWFKAVETLKKGKKKKRKGDLTLYNRLKVVGQKLEKKHG